jgi:GTP-binding protein Era
MFTTATRRHNLDKLLELIVSRLPEGEPLFPEDEFTNQSSRFMAAELVREKILIATRQEVPYAVAVMIDDWEEEDALLRIGASILVEKSSQRGILIGKGGQFLKKIGTQARGEIEELLGQKIFLELHVKVAEDWRQNPRILHELEYAE